MAQPPNLILSWSFSTLSMYEKCPYQLILRQEFKIPPNEYMQRGLDIHKQCEDYLNYAGEPPCLPWLSSGLSELRDLGAIPEQQYGITNTWLPELDFNNAHGKCILDAIVIANNRIRIIDFKTGKPAPIKHQDQAQIYAIAANVWHPEIEIIETEFWYIDSEKITKTSFTQKQLHFYKTILDARIQRMMNDAILPPKPSKFNCKWCAYKEHCWYSYHD